MLLLIGKLSSPQPRGSCRDACTDPYIAYRTLIGDIVRTACKRQRPAQKANAIVIFSLGKPNRNYTTSSPVLGLGGTIALVSAFHHAEGMV
jgi:hypothetical protein